MRMSAVLILTAFLASAASGQTVTPPEKKEEQKQYLYQWTDRAGVVHIADDLGGVPEQYRSKARRLESPRVKERGQGLQRGGGIVSSSPEGMSEEQQEAIKAEWKNRLWKEEQRLAEAEKQYSELEQKRAEALTSWGGVASGHLEGRMEADRLAQEMKQVQQVIDNARNQIENVIPEEARKAGIPPGWLRE